METSYRRSGIGGDTFQEKNGSAVSTFHSSEGSSKSRLLGEADVDTFGGQGTCQLRNSLDTLYNGEIAAAGAVFTVKALTNSIDIQGIEFANVEATDGSPVLIYARKGKDFSTNRGDWIQLATSTSVPSPDGLGAIAPRADMTRSVAMNQGDEWTFYISLQSNNLKMAESSAGAGASYQTDDYLQLNVGESVAVGPEFSSSRTENRAFQGKLHYRVLKPCNTLGMKTELIFPFAAEPGIDRRDLNSAVSAGFDSLLADEPDLARWATVHGLNIDGITLKSKGKLGMYPMVLDSDGASYWFVSHVRFFCQMTVNSTALILDASCMIVI